MARHKYIYAFGKSFPSIEICQFPFSSVTIQDFCIDLSNRSAGVKKKKNLVEEPLCTTLLCHEHIVNVFITQKQSNFELFIFSLNTLA